MRNISRRSLLASTGLALGCSALLGSGVNLTRALPTDDERAWPQGQHDARKTGAAPDIDAPTGEYLHRRWLHASPGNGYWDQPAVVDGTVYTINWPTAWGETDVAPVYAIDATDGSIQWQTDLGADDDDDFPLPVSPVVAEGIVCLATREFGMTGLNADTGDIEWHRENVQLTGPRYANAGSNPTLAGSTVFVPTRDKSVVALDITDGTTERVYSVKQEVSSVAVTDGLVVVGGTEGVVVVEGASGKNVWRVDMSTPVEHVIVADGHVFAVGENATVHALGLTSGAQQWTAPVQSRNHITDEATPIQPAPSVAKGRLVVSTPTDALTGSYTQDSALVARDTNTGDVLWTSEFLDGKATIAGSYVYATKDARGLVVGDLDDGTLVTFYVPHLRVQVGPDSSHTSLTDPVVVDGAIYYTRYARDDGGGRVVAVEPSDDVPQDAMLERNIGFLSDRGGEPYTVGEEITMGEKHDERNPNYTTNYALERGVLRVDFDGDGEYEWSRLVPDEGLRRETVPTWTYSEPGEYEVTAKFLDKRGRSTTATESITIIPRSELPDMGDARIEITKKEICGRRFTGSITGEGSGDPTYYWRFDDEPVPEFDPENAYDDGEGTQTSFYDPEGGTYYVRLVVEDDENQTVTTMKEFEL